MSIPPCKRVSQRGQGLVKYALILFVVLVAVAGLMLPGSHYCA